MRSFVFDKKCVRGSMPVLLAALVIFVFSGCAATGLDTADTLPGMDEAQQQSALDEQLAQDELKVRSIDVLDDGDKVFIATNRMAEYTAFTLMSPLRLVIDLPEADLYDVLDTIKINNQFLKNINVVTYGGKEKIGRIILELQEGVDHEVSNADDGVLIHFKQDPLAGMPEGYINEGGETVLVAALGDVALADQPAEEEVAEPEPMEPATTVEGVQSFTENSDLVIKIVSDGAIGKYNTFELSDPSRVVIDIWEVTNNTGLKVLRVDGAAIKDVRVGSHQDKVRFVIDISGNEIPPYVITKSGNHISAVFSPARVEGDQTEGENAAEPSMEDGGVIADNGQDSFEADLYREETALTNGLLSNVAYDAGGAAAEAAEDIAVAAAEDIAVAAVAEESAVQDMSAAAFDAGEGFASEETDETAMDNAPEEDAFATTEDTPDVLASNDYDSEVSEAIAETDAEIADALKTEEDAEAAVNEEEAAAEVEPETPVVEIQQETPAASVAPVILAGNNITDIDYKKIGEKGFLTIKTTEKPVYAIKESKNGKTIILDISDALIGADLVRTLDATKLGTPVATISSYQSSTSPALTRILVNLSKAATHSIMEIEGTLNLVFTPIEKPVLQKTAVNAAGEILGKTDTYTGKKIDLDMMDARVTDILRLLAEVSNLNIIASDEVTGTISLRLRDVPWDQAFDIILQSKGLDKIKVGNVIRVAPATRISQERDAALAAVKASEKLEPLDIEFVAINYGSAEDLAAHVKNVLSDRGSVTSETRTNTLIIKDIKKGIRAAEMLVTRLDTPIPQVLIEARIVEAESSFSRDLGVQWGVDYQTGGNVSTNVFGSDTSPGQTPPAGTNPAFQTRNGTQNFAVNLPATGSIGTLGALGFILGKAGQNPLVLDLRLSAGEQEGQLRTISRPRIVTMDNKEAKIEDGESIPFETTSASGTSTIFIDANLSLTVTPHITPDGSVLMKIKASKNSIGTFTTASGEPSIVKKEASTEVLVSDGETTVIGGIISSDSNITESGIPYLKDIPMLGKLFRSKSTKESQKELLIFITPTILKIKQTG